MWGKKRALKKYFLKKIFNTYFLSISKQQCDNVLKHEIVDKDIFDTCKSKG